VRGGGETALDSSLGIAVEKAQLGQEGQYNLSGERYQEATRTEYAVPRVPIGDVCVINPRKSEIAGLPPETIVSFAPMNVLNEHRISFHPNETKPLSAVGASYTYFR
jgi:type I restriction enzyme M protein